MSKLSDEIDRLIASVPSDTSRRYNCPVCKGEHTFSITKLGSVVKYNCFRASCNDGAPVAGHKSLQPTQEGLKKRFEGTLDTKPVFSMPPYWVQGIAFKDVYDVLYKTNSLIPYRKGYFRVAYDPSENRVCYLVQDDKSTVIGAVGRKLGYGTPKTLNYEGSAPKPFMCGLGNTVVLVEDCASACAVSNLEGFVGLALLGTNLKEEYIPYITKYENIIIALDYDARKKSIALKEKLSYYCKNVRVVILYKDLKDMENAGLSKVLSDGKYTSIH